MRMTASPSGRFGASTSRTIRLSPLDFRKYSRKVEVCPRMLPPMGWVGSPKKESGFDATQPIGGNILGHTSTFRIYLRKSKGDKRIVRLVDAPNLADGEAVMRVEDAGLKPE